MATLTVYSDAADGTLDSGHATDYSIARSGSGATIGVNTTGTDSGLIMGQRIFGAEYNCEEAFVGFDTSSLTAGATISAATLSLYLYADWSNTDFTCNARLYDWGAVLTTADWIAGASLSGYTLAASIASSGIGASAYKSLTESGTNLRTGINKTGTTGFVLSGSRHESGTAPVGDFVWDRLAFMAADKAGTSNDPKLEITYTPANTAPSLSVQPSATYATLTRTGPSNTWGVTFTATDAEQTGANALTYQIRTAAGGGGTLVSNGTCTSGVSKAITGLAYNASGLANGSNTLYVRIGDGTANTDSNSWTLLRDDTAPTAATSISTTPSPVV